jgi:hypothetical protein
MRVREWEEQRLVGQAPPQIRNCLPSSDVNPKFGRRWIEATPAPEGKRRFATGGEGAVVLRPVDRRAANSDGPKAS